jgi:hypothetical protein
MAAGDDLRQLLRDRGAETIVHPGGTLYAHLNRVHDRLLALGQTPDVALAGLGHAVYGTDGFHVTLATLHQRDEMRAIVGADVEAQIYRYAACDRRLTWRSLPRRRAIWDRFTGLAIEPDDRALAAFADLSIVNELDVCEHDPETKQRRGGYLAETFATWEGIASESVLAAAPTPS